MPILATTAAVSTLVPYSPSSGMSLGDLAEGVLAALYGQTSQTDATAALRGSIGSTDLTFQVDDPSDLSAGWIEVDLELMRVTSVDMTTGAVTIAPTGRGRRGTDAAAHAAGAEVRVQPIIPYSSVIREVRSELATIYPRISATCYAEITVNPTATAYELPADAGIVLDVRYKDTTGEWQRLRGWEVEHGQSVEDFPSGKAIRLSSPMANTVRVIYGRPFGALDSLDALLSDAGVPESLEDVIRYGAICRLLPTLDIARLSVTSTASSEANGRPPTPGTGVMVARELRAAYRERLDQEIRTFRSYFPAPVHLTR